MYYLHQSLGEGNNIQQYYSILFVSLLDGSIVQVTKACFCDALSLCFVIGRDPEDEDQILCELLRPLQDATDEVCRLIRMI